jgi:hypothetical protein
VERHFDVLGLSFRIGNNVEFHIWKLHILFLGDCARPEWLIILATNTMLFFQVFQKVNERLVWNKAETHTIIDNKLLIVAGERGTTFSNLDVL